MQARWRICADEEALAVAAAQTMLAAISEAPRAPAICLTGGSTPKRLYALLARNDYAQRIPWRDAHWFVGDDRFVPLDSPDSNMGEARRILLDGRAPAENVHAIRTQGLDLDESARRYEQDLRAFAAAHRAQGAPLFSFLLLGVGPDGHVASLFPGQATLQERARLVLPVRKPGLAPFHPRVTLSFPALASSARTAFLVAGDGKAEILRAIACGADAPAAQVEAQGEIEWFVDAAAAARLPRLFLIMGVSGAGKTTVGIALAKVLGLDFLDADDLHSAQNKQKMHDGEPLTDADRRPWLAAVTNAIASAAAQGRSLVVACSALRRDYREELVAASPHARIVYLRGAPALIAKRVANRAGHFMAPALLPDQYRVLEEPARDEDVLTIDVDAPVETIVARIRRELDGPADRPADVSP